MADDDHGKGAGDGADDESKLPEPADVSIDNPLLAYVKGATPTEASERLYEQRYREGESRRRQDDIDRALASTPVEKGGGKMFSHQLTENPDVPKAYLLLHYVDRGGNRMFPGECLADVLIEDWDNPSDLTLGLMCPICWRSGVKHAQDCQLKLKMSNRGWHLETGAGKPMFVFDDGYGPKQYRSAGVIRESEVFSCADCSWRARIVNNQIRSE
jgi:hypothetical protein